MVDGSPTPTGSPAGGAAAPIVGSNHDDGTPSGPGGGSTGLLEPLLLTFLVGAGGLFLFLFVRRRRTDDDGQPAGSFGLATAAAVAGATAPLPVRAAGPSAPAAAAVVIKAAKPGKSAAPSKAAMPAKASRKRVGKPSDPAPVGPPVAGPDAAAKTDATSPPDAADLPDPTSWEVSDDAPLAATSAAYAATQAAVAEPPTVHTFETPAAPGVERALIRSRLVRLSAEPDDLRSAELGRLDRGDEVEIIDSFEGYLYVRVPDGTQGWIRRAALV